MKLGMLLLTTFLIIALLAVSAAARVIRVSPTGDDENDGSSWGEAMRTIGAALASASYGDEIWVAAGTYTENITLVNGVPLYGGFAGDETYRDQRDWSANESIIDGGGAGSVVTAPSGVTSDTTIDGFTVKNGTSSGIYCSSSYPIIANNKITNCSAAYGGGIYSSGHAITVTGNTITNCTVTVNGAAIYCGTYSTSTISENTITQNTRIGSGYAVHCTASCTVRNNIISSNTAGGVYFSAACTIAGNMITGNSGTGIYSAYCSSTITSNTIAGNGYSGILCFYPSAGTSVADNIIVSNTGYGISRTGGTPFTPDYNDVWHNTTNYYQVRPGGHSISVDPDFVNGSAGDYHLQSTSPCIDKGNDNASGIPTTDIDGQPRKVDIPDVGDPDVLVDMGADEYYPDYQNEPMVDRGLPTSNVNGVDRCNIRWADVSTTIGYGDDFALWRGPQWVIDKIVVWIVPDILVSPAYFLGDHYSDVKLYLGTGSLALAASGSFSTGSNNTSNGNIAISAVQYGTSPAVDYQCADGTYNQIWKIEFGNLNRTVPANTTEYFGVIGTPRVDRLWFNHATNRTGSGCDGYLRKFDLGDLSGTTSASGAAWFAGKGSDIDVQVYAHPSY